MVKVYAQAAKYIGINRDKLKQSVQFILDRQVRRRSKVFLGKNFFLLWAML